jgi:hypothetical protein
MNAIKLFYFLMMGWFREHLLSTNDLLNKIGCLVKKFSFSVKSS